MKAVRDYRILMPNIPYYATGLTFNEFAVVYYTGINSANYSYTGPNGSFSIQESVTPPFRTGYYYLTKRLTSGENLFFKRPDATITGPTQNPWTQDFFFVPCYGSSINFKSNFSEILFQDNYKVITAKNSNSVNCEATLEFKTISDDEFKAINHYYQRSFTDQNISGGQGKKTIPISLFPPHTKLRDWYLKSINTDYENVDANNISVFLENPFISQLSWKEKLIPFSYANEYTIRNYSKHDYVLARSLSSNNGFYYYSGDTVNALPPGNPNSFWTNKFYFKPDLINNLNFESLAFKNEIDDFYLYQTVGINPNFFDFSLTFSNRNDKEAKALLHFLENHNGIDSFKYDLHSFFTGERYFFCPEWSHTYNFSDNNTISARFIELKNIETKTSNFDSEIVNGGFNFGFLPNGFSINKNIYVQNNERKYPITYTILDKVENPVFSSDFFSTNGDKNIQVKPGSSGYFNVSFSIPENVSSSTPTSPKGYFPILQENEIVGSEGGILQLNYSGVRVNSLDPAPNDFLSGVLNCVASPVYDNNVPSILVRWTIPENGYFYTGFSGRISSSSGFANHTGSFVPVELNQNSYLYEIGTPGETTYYTTFSGIPLNTPLYISISGVNNNYSNHSAPYVFASGVGDALNWDNPSTTFPAVQSGLTTGLIASLGISAPSITLVKGIKQKNLSNFNYEYLDLFQYITDQFSFSNSSSLYSGLELTLSNVKIGPQKETSDYDIYNSGSLIITGDFSSLPSGITLNLINNTQIYGKGGSSSVNSSNRAGKSAIYLKCSGKLNIFLDSSSCIAGGGGAGENINFSDLAEYENDKFNQLKETFRNDNYCLSGISDSVNNVKYSKIDISRIYDFYNNQSVKINSQTCSSVGSSIFYDFFASQQNQDQDFILGAPGASYGLRSGTALFGTSFSSESEKPGQPDFLINLLSLGKNFYQ